ncbi:hypothetical protein BDR06DRAFT_967456 [Suillus hirtellus]|nr:hypothetical protein BDR06DRAFT_967456 [Suillus hirtellus]
MSASASSHSSRRSTASHVSASNPSQINLTPPGLECYTPFTCSSLHTIIQDRKWAYWEAVICDPQYALRLDDYLSRTNDDITIQIVNTFRAADALTGDIARINLSRDSSLSSISTRYNQGKIKQALLNLLEFRNFHTAVVGIEEEQAFSPPPDPVEVIECAVFDRAPTPFILQPLSELPEPIPNVTQLTNPEIDQLFNEYEHELYAPRNPSPPADADTISITIPKLEECPPDPPAINPDD